MKTIRPLKAPLGCEADGAIGPKDFGIGLVIAGVAFGASEKSGVKSGRVAVESTRSSESAKAAEAHISSAQKHVTARIIQRTTYPKCARRTKRQTFCVRSPMTAFNFRRFYGDVETFCRAAAPA
jgi:hypothetical protein